MPIASKETQTGTSEAKRAWRHYCTIDANVFIYGIIALSVVCVLAAIAIHIPGQISMDTSIQLYEAATGEAASFNPPFMSALLRWLGGGEQSTSLLVAINAILLYGSMATVAIVLTKTKSQNGVLRVQAWQVVACTLLIINPIVFIYSGIVWKDVLFGALLSAACSLGIAATAGNLLSRMSCILACLLLLSMGYLTRQQGLFMVPILLCAPVIAIWSCFPTKKFISALSLFLAFSLVTLGLQTLVKLSIHSPDEKYESVGYSSIMKFDLAGIVNYSTKTNLEFAYPISAEQVISIRSVYSPSRVDYLDREQLSREWLTMTPDTLKQAWISMIVQNPGAYFEHRLQSYATLLGLKGIEGTLPVHIGIDGNPEYLKAVGMNVETGVRSHLLYRFASSFFDWPIYRHIFWLGLMICLIAVGSTSRYNTHIKSIGFLIALATTLMYASFLPTTIASDFRYLFGAIPLVAMLGLIWVLGRTSNSPKSQTK